MTQEFVELLQQEIERIMETHQVEIDRRFDRLAGRISELETDLTLLGQEGAQRIRNLEAAAVTEDGLRTWWQNHQQELDKHFRWIEVAVSEAKIQIGDLKSDLRAGRNI